MAEDLESLERVLRRRRIPMLGNRGTWGGPHGLSRVLEGVGLLRGELMVM